MAAHEVQDLSQLLLSLPSPLRPPQSPWRKCQVFGRGFQGLNSSMLPVPSRTKRKIGILHEFRPRISARKGTKRTGQPQL
jgi:hypothetical protein